VLRIVAGFLFLQHGTDKLFGWPSGGPTVHLGSLLGLAGVIESVGGSLILLGLFTRVAAFITSGEMAVAFFKVHLPQAFLPIKSHGELAVMFCFVFLYIAAAGPGPLSIDALRGGSRG
jgi:putative oxidoreductase